MKLRTILTLAAVMLFATGAQAQFGIKIGGKKKLSVGMGDLDPSKPSKDQRKALSTVNSMSQKGAGKVPGNWSSGYEKKSARFAEAVKIHDDLTALIKKKKLKKLKPWSNVERYWNNFDAKVTQGKLQLPVLKAYEPVKSAFSNKKLVDAKLITELQAATKAYSAGASDGNKKNAEWFAKFAAEAPETNKKLEAAGALKAAKAASAAEAKAQNAQLDQLDASLKTWAGITKAAEAPIDAAEIATYEATLAEVTKFKESAPAWYGDRLFFFKAYNHWFAGADAAFAKALAGGLNSKGDTKGKKAKIVIKAKAGTCYAVFGKWKVASGSEKMNLDWSFSVPTHALNFSTFRTPMGRMQGFCANKDLKATRAGSLTFAGTKNSWHYTVVEWKHEAFPMAIAASMSYGKPDPCSPEHMLQYWTKPVPGAAIYKGNEPLMRGSDDDTWLTARTLNNIDTRVQWKSLKSVSPKARTFGNAFSHARCWGADSSHDKLAVKFGKCKIALDKQFGPKFDKAYKKKNRAKYISEVKSANRTIEKLENAKNKAFKAKCAPTKKKIDKRMEANFNKLVDWYAENAPVNTLDVQKHIVLQRDAKFDRPGRR